MKAVVYHGIGDIRLDDVPDPKIEAPTDAIVRVTAAAICGTDLHMVRGTTPGMVPGTIMGHEAIGLVEQVGPGVRNLNEGDRVVIPSSIACGYCSYCRAGYYSQCDNANPNGKRAGTAFFGGPKSSGAFHGLQAERARIPYANVGPVKLPDGVTDNQALMLSDIFPTGYFGADIAEIMPGDTVAVFGCGPVGQFAVASAFLFGAGRVFAVDHIPSRLETARDQGAEIINFEEENPVQVILELTGGIGVDRVIDAVGVDAQRPHRGPASGDSDKLERQFEQERQMIAPQTNVQGGNWAPGDAPSQAFTWEIEALDKAGTLAIIGVYPQSMRFFPMGEAFGKNLTINMGNCPHRKYIPTLVNMVESHMVDPNRILTRVVSLDSAVDAYRAFDERQSGWLKVELVPGLEPIPAGS